VEIQARETAPSAADIRTTQILERLFSGFGLRCRTFAIFWNEISEHRILEYDGNGTCRLVQVFDGAA